MEIPTRPALLRHWNWGDTNLEDLLLVKGFFTGEDPGTAKGRPPLIVQKDGGLLGLYAMEGLDPEGLGNDELTASSCAVGRVLDLMNPENLEGRWAGGTWEVQNLFTRREARPPLLAPPTRNSAVLRYLSKACNDYNQQKTVFQDEVVWLFKYIPKYRLRMPWRRKVWDLMNEAQHIGLLRSELQAQAWMVRRTLHAVEESMGAFRTSRPRMEFGMRQPSEQEAFDIMWRHVNRRSDTAPRLRADLPLDVQLAASERVATADGDYRVNGRYTKVLTWKVPPSGSIGYMFARLQNELRFPFTLAQNFRAIHPRSVEGRTKSLGRIARTLARKFPTSAAYAREANGFLSELGMGRCPFDWQFTIIVDGATAMEAEDRVARLSGQLRNMQAEKLGILAGEPLEERSNRVFAELATMPGNGQYALRENRITSRAAGDLAMVYRLSPGDDPPMMLFGDRKGGVFGYSNFSRREPNWNKAILGRPGSGKSTIMNSIAIATAMFPSQVYVFDKGNSYGPLFEVWRADMADEVAVMRLGDGHFHFNPYPLAWALEERDRQKANGTYRLPLADGGSLPDPVEESQRVFEAWLPGLLAATGKELDRREREYLDRALKGRNGEGGFYLEYESICRSYLRDLAKGRKVNPPRPLTSLLGHLQNQKLVPQLAEALEFWTRHPRDKYFDTGEDSVSTAKFVYFELTGLKEQPDLVVPFVGALMGTIWRRIQDPRFITEYKAVIADEFWSFLAQNAFLGFAEQMFREMRKFRGFIVVGSHTPNDLKEGPQRALLQCTSEKFLFNGFREDVFMRQDLQLEDHHLELHRGLRADGQRREVLYASESGLTRVLSIDIPPALYWFATTDGEDKHWRSVFTQHFGGLPEGVEHLIKACEGVPLGIASTRLKRVAEYAAAHGIRGVEKAA
jgi:hypothetical protein